MQLLRKDRNNDPSFHVTMRDRSAVYDPLIRRSGSSPNRQLRSTTNEFIQTKCSFFGRVKTLNQTKPLTHIEIPMLGLPTSNHLTTPQALGPPTQTASARKPDKT